MRTSSLALSVFLLGGSAPALALDASARAPQPPAVSFGSVKDAIRSGVRDYNAGNKLGAARADT